MARSLSAPNLSSLPSPKLEVPLNVAPPVIAIPVLVVASFSLPALRRVATSPTPFIRLLPEAFSTRKSPTFTLIAPVPASSIMLWFPS